MSKKTKTKKFYARFYATGELRAIKASSLEEAYKIAQEKFGEATGVYKIGDLVKASEYKPGMSCITQKV